MVEESVRLEPTIVRKGRVVKKDKTEHHVIVCLYNVAGDFCSGLRFLFASIVQASPGPDSAASSATFRTKCAMCHGPDGKWLCGWKEHERSGSSVTVVQKVPDAELAQVIANGKGGMPSFKNSLSDEQIMLWWRHSLSASKK